MSVRTCPFAHVCRGASGAAARAALLRYPARVAELQLDPEALQALIDARMPFGKYQGVALLDLPEPYLVWFSRQGFPPGKLGRQLALTLEIKTNGLEKLLRPLR